MSFKMYSKTGEFIIGGNGSWYRGDDGQTTLWTVKGTGTQYTLGQSVTVSSKET